jgi:heme oxygenase
MSPALERMRAELRPHHDAIERTVRLAEESVTRELYVDFLARMLGFVEPCEARLLQATGRPPADLNARLKSSLLRQTLEALSLTEREVARLPRAASLPSLDRWPDALGYLYVLEGSTLGSQVLLRHLQVRLALSPAQTAYLRGYGADVGVMWKTFLADLERGLSASASAERAIVETARDTFTRLDTWLQGPDPRLATYPLRARTL